MGIRLNKTMGYGLVDVEHEDMTLTDKRFNPNGIMFDDSESKYSLEGYHEFLKEEAGKLDSIDAWDYHFEARSVYEEIQKGDRFHFERCFIP